MKSKRSRQKRDKARSIPLRPVGALLGVLALSLVAYGKGAFEPASTQSSGSDIVEFTDARRQAAEFISYDDSIVLNAAQKKVMHEALSSIPAPCCNQFSIATCCCPCNLAKSTWGLSKSLISEQHADVVEVRAAAVAWLQFSNPDGYTGDVCATGGCGRSFKDNGCGGMDRAHVQ